MYIKLLYQVDVKTACKTFYIQNVFCFLQKHTHTLKYKLIYKKFL